MSGRLDNWNPYKSQVPELKKKIIFVVIDKSLTLLVLNIFTICGIFASPVIMPKIVANIEIRAINYNYYSSF